MKTLLPLLFAFVVSAPLLHAQQKKWQEVIHLKNGSIIRSVQSLHHLDSLIEIKTSEGSIFRFEAADLDHITREVIRPDFRTRGYFVGVELGLNTGRNYSGGTGSNARVSSPSIHVITGFQWTGHWATGVGASLDIYQTGTFIPVYVHGMYMPLNSRLTPVATMDLGYGFYTKAFNGDPASNQRITGGLFLNPAVGFMVRSPKRTAFLFTVGYRQQDFSQAFQNGEIRTSQAISLRRMSLRMSLLF